MFQWLAKSSPFYLHAKEDAFMFRPIALAALAVIFTVSVSYAVALPLARQNPALSPAEVAKAAPGYMYILKSNKKDNYIITTLADCRVLRMQLILELDKSLEPKNQKETDHRMLALQDSLLQIIRTQKSDDLSAVNQNTFKQRITDAASEVLGQHAVHSVYLTGVTIQ